jgi:hypothetical protein
MEERMGRLCTRSWTLIGAATAVVALVAPATAPAQVTIDAYKITPALQGANSVPLDGPSSFQAGGNPDAGSWSRFTYPNATEDIQVARTNFAAGLLGNPESVPKCPEAALQAGGATCPSGSAIGSSRLDAAVAGTTFVPPTGSLTGTVYNAVPLGNEPGRLGVITPTGASTFLYSSIPFYITPRGGGDYGLTGVLSDINRLPAALFGSDLQVRALSFVLTGSTNKYVRNPTSCGTHISTGDASGYDDPTPIAGPPYGFNTIGCDTVPFSPGISFEMGDRGSTAFNKFPPVVVKITQPAGTQADILGNKITLPVELNTNNPAYKTCTQAQADADACPANSKFGGVVAKSPFLAEELKGPVYLIQQTNTSLPGLLLDLNGRVHVKIQTRTTLINNKRIQSLVLNAPQLPVSELRVALNGGRTTGVFLNRADLCFKGNSTSKFNNVDSLVKFYGHNGKNTADATIKAKVNGCGPGVTGSITGATSIRPSVRVKAQKHPDSPNYKELRVSLSDNLSLVRSRINSGVDTSADASVEFVDRHTLRVFGLPAAGEDEITVSFRKGAVRVSNRSQDLLERGRSRPMSVKVRQTPVTGQATSTRDRFTAKGKR